MMDITKPRKAGNKINKALKKIASGPGKDGEIYPLFELIDDPFRISITNQTRVVLHIRNVREPYKTGHVYIDLRDFLHMQPKHVVAFIMNCRKSHISE